MEPTIGNEDMSMNGGSVESIVKKSNNCNQCDSKFTTAGNLKRHFTTHSGEKLNKCSQCDFASSQAGNLRTHLKTHSGEKPNKCNQCDYASALAGNLKQHLKTHSGEKLNRCNQCNYVSSFFIFIDQSSHHYDFLISQGFRKPTITL